RARADGARRTSAVASAGVLRSGRPSGASRITSAGDDPALSRRRDWIAPRSSTAVRAARSSLPGDRTGTTTERVAVARASSQRGGSRITPSVIAVFGQVTGSTTGAGIGALL